MKRCIISVSAPYMGIEKPPMTDTQKQMKRKTKKVNEEVAYDMLEQLSPEKKQQLDKFLSRNEALTSTYGCSFGNLRIYHEGFYLTLDGTRSQFSVWYFDNDGELVEGRKPNESRLNFIYEQDLKFNGIDWYDLVNSSTDVTCAVDKNADPKTGWPSSDWWLSNDRSKDEIGVSSYIADPEEKVLNDLGLYITVYKNDLEILDDNDTVLTEMDLNRYIDNELSMAASCRSKGEFEGKYRMWIEHLIESEGLDDNYLNWDVNHR